MESALNDLKEALKGTDSAAIKAKEEALMKAMEPVAQEMYAHAQASGAQPGAGANPGNPGESGNSGNSGNTGNSGKGGDDVVDADFTMK